MDLYCQRTHWTKMLIGSKSLSLQIHFVQPTHALFVCFYRCRKCSYTVSGKSILILMDRLFDELDMLDPDSVKEYEEYLKRYANVLHRNHYLILSAKHSLCQLIGRSDGFIINELDLTQLQRKEEYCRDLLDVVNVLEPGASRLRGIICYELHAPLMMKITREFENRIINSNQLRSRLKEVRTKLALTIGFLNFFLSINDFYFLLLLPPDRQVTPRVKRNSQNRATRVTRIFNLPCRPRRSQEDGEHLKCEKTKHFIIYCHSFSQHHYTTWWEITLTLENKHESRHFWCHENIIFLCLLRFFHHPLLCFR